MTNVSDQLLGKLLVYHHIKRATISSFDSLHFVSWISNLHYGNVIMGVMASQITSPTIVCSIVYSDADQRNHQSSASLAFVWGNSPSPPQMISYAENVSIWWRHHALQHIVAWWRHVRPWPAWAKTMAWRHLTKTCDNNDNFVCCISRVIKSVLK